LPDWLNTVQIVADIAWKLAAAIAVGLGSPRLMSALKTWHEVKTAQLEADREIERKRREAVEADFERATKVLPLLERSAEALQRQVESTEAKFQTLLNEQHKTVQELDKTLLPLIARLLARSVSLEIMRHNLLRGSAIGEEVREVADRLSTGNQELTEDQLKLHIAWGFLKIAPNLFGNAPEAIIGAAEQLARFTSQPASALRSAGEAMAEDPAVVELLQDTRRWGSPLAISEKYVLAFLPRLEGDVVQSVSSLRANSPGPAA
jgi:hypothetical protein